MNHKIALYQGPDGLWYWNILNIRTEFCPSIPYDGFESSLKKAINSATRQAKKVGVKVAFVYMERAYVEPPRS